MHASLTLAGCGKHALYLTLNLEERFSHASESLTLLFPSFTFDGHFPSPSILCSPKTDIVTFSLTLISNLPLTYHFIEVMVSLNHHRTKCSFFKNLHLFPIFLFHSHQCLAVPMYVYLSFTRVLITPFT